MNGRSVAQGFDGCWTIAGRSDNHIGTTMSRRKAQGRPQCLVFLREKKTPLRRIDGSFSLAHTRSLQQ